MRSLDPVAWWLQMELGVWTGPSRATFSGCKSAVPHFGLPQRLPGLMRYRFLDFWPVGGLCASHRMVPHPHPTALMQGVPGPLWEKHSRTEEVVRVVGLGEVWPEPQQ